MCWLNGFLRRRIFFSYNCSWALKLGLWRTSHENPYSGLFSLGGAVLGEVEAFPPSGSKSSSYLTPEEFHCSVMAMFRSRTTGLIALGLVCLSLIMLVASEDQISCSGFVRPSLAVSKYVATSIRLYFVEMVY